MTLGELVAELQKYPEGSPVRFDWPKMVPAGIMSWRGDYSQLAMDYEERPFNKRPTVKEVLQYLEGALAGETFHGYKGGNFAMGPDTLVWVSEYGEAEECQVIGVAFTKHKEVILQTGYRKYQMAHGKVEHILKMASGMGREVK